LQHRQQTADGGKAVPGCGAGGDADSQHAVQIAKVNRATRAPGHDQSSSTRGLRMSRAEPAGPRRGWWRAVNPRPLADLWTPRSPGRANCIGGVCVGRQRSQRRFGKHTVMPVRNAGKAILRHAAVGAR
jgi:hypothetical protein